MLLLVVVSVSYVWLLAPKALAYELNETILELSSLQEDQIDIGRVALTLAKEAYPNLDVEAYSKKLDRMVQDIQKLTKGRKDADYRIRALNTYLYKYHDFHYDKEDRYARKPKNRYLNGLLDTESGSCVTLPVLYLALAQRLGYPVYPVSAPQHIFLRYVDASVTQNIEATGSGGNSPDDAYIHDLEIPQRGIESGAYMETMTYRELLGDLIAEQAGFWARKKYFNRALAYYEVALELEPNAAEVYRLYGHVHQSLVRRYHRYWQTLDVVQNTSLDVARNHYHSYKRKHIMKRDKAFNQARALGAAPPLKANYWIRQNQLSNIYNNVSIKQKDIPS